MSDSLLIEAALVEVEAGGYGVDPTPVSGTDDLVLADRIWPGMDDSFLSENLRDGIVSGTLLPVAPTIPAGRIVRSSFGIEPRVKGSAYTTAIDLRGTQAVLRACGLSVTVNASGLDFTWVSAALESATAYFYAGGNLYKVVGNRGKCSIRGEAGQQLLIRAELTGLLRADPTAVAVPAITYMPNAGPSVVNAVFTDGSWSPDFEWFELDFGQDVRILRSGNATDSIGKIGIARHRPRLRLRVEQAALATRNVYTDVALRTVRTFSTTLGSGAGSRIKLTGVTAYLNSIKKVDFEGFTGYELEYIVTAGTFRFD